MSYAFDNVEVGLCDIFSKMKSSKFIRFLVIVALISSHFERVLRAEPYRPFHHLWYGTRDLPDSQNYYILAAGTVATLGALTLDRSIHHYFTGQDRMGRFDDIGNDFLGTGLPGALIGIGTVGYGLLFSNSRAVNSGEAHLESLFATAIYTSFLKHTVRRERPESHSRTSFPSGHTSTTFVSAASLYEMHGLAAGVPAFLLAALTGVSRLNSNSHHLSDVVFGATLGIIVGHSYSQHHKNQNLEQRDQPNDDESQFQFLPYFDSKNNFGLFLHQSFSTGKP